MESASKRWDIPAGGSWISSKQTSEEDPLLAKKSAQELPQNMLNFYILGLPQQMMDILNDIQIMMTTSIFLIYNPECFNHFRKSHYHTPIS